jgi:hypothetical protein
VPRLNPDQRRRAQRFAQAKGITCQRCGSAYLLCGSTLRSYLGGGFSLDLWCQNQVAHPLGHGARTPPSTSPRKRGGVSASRHAAKALFTEARGRSVLGKHPFVLLISRVYNCNIIYKMLESSSLALMRQPQRRKGVKMQTKTYTTETGAKKAAARAYRPAIVRLPNGRYACFYAGDPLPQGARAVSRWGTNQWRAYE